MTTLGVVLAVVVVFGRTCGGGRVGRPPLLDQSASGAPYRHLKAASSLDVGEIGQALDGAVRMTSGRLPSDVQAKVAEIRREILELLPSTSGFSVGSEDLYVIQRTATDYPGSDPGSRQKVLIGS